MRTFSCKKFLATQCQDWFHCPNIVRCTARHVWVVFGHCCRCCCLSFCCCHHCFVMANVAFHPHLETVGLNSNANERSCTVHEVCGHHTQVRDVLHVVPCTITCSGTDKPSIKCVKAINRLDTCTFACVPQLPMNLPKAQAHLSKFVWAVEIFENSADAQRRAKARSN